MPWIVLLFLLLFGCGKPKEEVPATKVQKPYAGDLYLYALDSFRTSGLEGSIIPDFQKQENCTIHLTLFENVNEMALAIRDKPDSIDIAIGIDGGRAIVDSLLPFFMEMDKEGLKDIERGAMIDYSNRLIPYGYSYLSLLYNSRIIKTPPVSFGELQDSKYYNQMAICDASTSGIGMATLLWSQALFGKDGYEHMLRALKKNVYRSYTNPQEAIQALKKGECALMLGLNTTSSWMQELDISDEYIQTSMFKEGSYLYSENAGILKTSGNPLLAQLFLKYIISDPAQKMVVYKAGLLPANRKTALPSSFSNMPLSTWTVNGRLSADDIAQNGSVGMEFWSRLFGGM